jgi:putative ABC transport system permease protein
MYLGIFVDAPQEHYHMIRQDIVYALRTMRAQKLITIAAILVLALGIGSTTTIFTLIDGLLLRPLPYPSQERLVYVEEHHAATNLRGAVAYPNYLDFRAGNRLLEELSLFSSGFQVTLRGEMDAERIPAAAAAEPLFRVLGITPLMGRTFSPAEDLPGAPPTVVIGEELWRRRFGGNPAILDQTIEIGTPPARVIGIMPHGFHFAGNAELWVPLRLNPKQNTRMDHGLEAIARLRPGVTVEQAQEELRSIMSRISREHPTETYGQTVNVMPFRARDTRQMEPVLLALLGAVGVVMLIVCVNITNLLLAKASGRTREIAIRGALGASRARLGRQFVVESTLLALTGAAAGMVFAWAVVRFCCRWFHSNCRAGCSLFPIHACSFSYQQ